MSAPAIPLPADPRDPRLAWRFLEPEPNRLECWVAYAPEGFDVAAMEAHLTQYVTNASEDDSPVPPDELPELHEWLRVACFRRLLQRLWLYNDRRHTPEALDEPLPWGIASSIYNVHVDWNARQRERRRASQLASSEALRLAREGFAQRAKLAERR